MWAKKIFCFTIFFFLPGPFQGEHFLGEMTQMIYTWIYLGSAPSVAPAGLACRLLPHFFGKQTFVKALALPTNKHNLFLKTLRPGVALPPAVRV